MGREEDAWEFDGKGKILMGEEERSDGGGSHGNGKGGVHLWEESVGLWRNMERISWRKGREKLKKRVVREEEGGTHGGKDRLGGRGGERR